MHVEYYEARAVAKIPGISGARRICLDDWHKMAWDLFCGGKRHYEGSRPFIFRVHQIDAERVFITVRSPQGFPGAVLRQADVENGQKVSVDICYLPLHRPNKDGQREYVMQSDAWPGMADHTLSRAGLIELADPRTALVSYYRMFPKKVTPIPVVQASRAAVIGDEKAFAAAVVNGIGRKRGYGMGTLVWDFAQRSEQAA